MRIRPAPSCLPALCALSVVAAAPGGDDSAATIDALFAGARVIPLAKPPERVTLAPGQDFRVVELGRVYTPPYDGRDRIDD